MTEERVSMIVIQQREYYVSNTMLHTLLFTCVCGWVNLINDHSKLHLLNDVNSSVLNRIYFFLSLFIRAVIERHTVQMLKSIILLFGRANEL